MVSKVGNGKSPIAKSFLKVICHDFPSQNRLSETNFFGATCFRGVVAAVACSLKCEKSKCQPMTYLNASQLGVLGVLVYSHRCCASKEVLKQLKNVKVKNIDCTALAWAVVSQNGEVFTWGMPCSGGDSRDVQDRLQNVTKVVASHAAFAALLEDGSVVSWGDPLFGGDDLEVRAELKNIVKLFCCYNMFLAIRQDGKAIR